MKKFQLVILTFLFATSLAGAQSLHLVPHFNLLYPTSRLVDNDQGYSTFGSRNFKHSSGNFGVFAEYQSKQRWRLASGITIGGIGLGYKISYRNPGAYISRSDQGMGVIGDFYRVPLLFIYTWKDVHLFQLRNFRKIPKRRRPEAVDESIFYALLFKVQPIVGASVNYIGALSRWGEPGDTLNNHLSSHYFEIDRPVKQLRTVNVSFTAGVRFQFYSFGKDRLALTVLYHQGLRDMLEMDVQYTIDGSDPYRSIVRTRGSGLSVTLSYPIQIFNFNKQERELKRDLKSPNL
uniref:PorT family protein n=1 Tax=Roseihalotalea indica TaxID=2867963 RepID=A0AA49GS67_9BACT|nr:hypothetical protein K4G66_09620 [Tunicatimonas sp. TK19036]